MRWPPHGAAGNNRQTTNRSPRISSNVSGGFDGCAESLIGFSDSIMYKAPTSSQEKTSTYFIGYPLHITHLAVIYIYTYIYI